VRLIWTLDFISIRLGAATSYFNQTNNIIGIDDVVVSNDRGRSGRWKNHRCTRTNRIDCLMTYRVFFDRRTGVD